MLHGLDLHGYGPYARGLRSDPIEWITRWIAHKRKSTNLLSYSKQWISFSYHLLLIIHAYNAGISWLPSYTRLQSQARLQSKDMTHVALPDFGRCHKFGRISWLRSHIMTLINECTACLTTLAMKNIIWPGYTTAASYTPETKSETNWEGHKTWSAFKSLDLIVVRPWRATKEHLA
jgi:hypothetical protein